MTLDICSPRVRWHLPVSLLKAGRLPLDEWLADGRAMPVKLAPHRAVWRATIAGTHYHIKEYRSVGVRGRLREILRPIKAHNEYEAARSVRARGLLAPTPVGWGVLGSPLAPRASFLITETVADARPLQEWIESGELPPCRRQRLARDLGRFLLRMHANGVVHGDPHPGNFLVRWTGRHPEFVLLDLHTVRVGDVPTSAERRKNVAFFNRYFALRASRADRIRFWRAYAGADDPRPVERLTATSNQQLWMSRDGRCLRSNRYYRRVEAGPLTGYAVRELPADVIDRITADPDAVFASSPLLKDSRTSTVADVDGIHIFKRFRVTTGRDPWLGLVRPTPALRSWALGHGMIERRLPTPRPLLVLHRYRAGRPAEGYLLTEKIADARDLREFVRARPADARAVIEPLARLIRTMHERRIRHRDLKAANLLIANGRISFIDLVGARVVKDVTRRLAVKDLSRLLVSFLDQPAVTRGDRLRFLRTYMNWHLRGKAGWKLWWRELEKLALQKLQRNARRGRMVA